MTPRGHAGGRVGGGQCGGAGARPRRFGGGHTEKTPTPFLRGQKTGLRPEISTNLQYYCHRGGGWFASSSLGDNDDDDRRLLVLEWPEGERRGSSSAKATSSTGTGTGGKKRHLVLRRLRRNHRACNLLIIPRPSERLLLLRGVRDPMEGRWSRLRRRRLRRLGRRLRRPGDTAAPCLRRGDAASLQPVLRAASLASSDLLCPGTRRGLSSRLPLPGRPRERWRSHPVLY